MNILVIGHDSHLQECSAKFGKTHQYTLTAHRQEAEKFFGTTEVIFDFTIASEPAQMEVYRDHLKITAFLNTSTISLAQLTREMNHQINGTLFGFCGMPTFLHRELLEVSLRSQKDSAELQRVCKNLNTEYRIVDDRVGLVTPRVICMIINEAYYTVQEGTATREDIDIAMKLGTNYPFGPFEWCEKIGIRYVYELLNAVYEDTKDERYKLCPLLQKEFLLRTH
jgi:3-hydroxybutyryl-CoA dehydrogenase